MDGRLIFLHPSWGQVGGRFAERERPASRGRPARARALMTPKSREAKSRKAPRRLNQAARTKTDTGRREEHSQALERTLAKELGKLTP